MLRRQYSQQESSTRRMSAEAGVDVSPNQRRMYAQNMQQHPQYQHQQSYQQMSQQQPGGPTGHHAVQSHQINAYGHVQHQQPGIYPEDDPKYYQVIEF
jgi:hypothetical protein